MEKFTSRRDRQSQKQVQVNTDKKPALKTTPWYRKRGVIIGGVVAVILLIMLAVSITLLTIASKNRTEEIRRAYEASQEHLTALEGVIADGAPSDERVSQLGAWSSDLETLKCGGRIKLPWLANNNQRCKAYNETSIELKGKVDQAANMLRYDAALQQALTPVIETNKIEDITAELAKWQETTDQIDRLTGADEMGEVHVRLVERVHTLRDTWSQLKVANDEEDSEMFRELEASLPEKYSNLQMIREELARLYGSTQIALLEAAEKHHD